MLTVAREMCLIFSMEIYSLFFQSSILKISKDIHSSIHVIYWNFVTCIQFILCCFLSSIRLFFYPMYSTRKLWRESVKTKTYVRASSFSRQR